MTRHAAVSAKLHHEVNDLRLSFGRRFEAELAEYFAHRRVLRQDFGNQLLEPGAARDRSEIAADVDALSN